MIKFSKSQIVNLEDFNLLKKLEQAWTFLQINKIINLEKVWRFLQKKEKFNNMKG